MAYTTTTRLELEKAVPGSAQVFETTSINANWDKIDAEAVATDERLDIAESQILGLDSMLSSTNAAVTALDGRLDTAESDIDAAQADIIAIQATLGATSTVTTVSASSYSILAGDATDTLRFTSASAVTVTVDDVLANAGYINCVQDGTGQVSFVAGTGVTLQSPSGYTKISTQYGWASIIRVAAGEYRLVGNLSA